MAAPARPGHNGAMRGLVVAVVLAMGGTAVAEARSVADVVRTLGPEARGRLRPHFERAGVAYPPRAATFVVLKGERRFELWAEGAKGPRLVREYEIQAASGGPGPKLAEGDLQVPEGLYKVLFLNPTSSYHLSMKLDYPNAFDRRQAARDRRTRLGGDIFIHGRDVSIGCVALGDPSIEELFVLAHDVGVPRLQALIVPYDFRRRQPDAAGLRPDLPWLGELYTQLESELRRYAR